MAYLNATGAGKGFEQSGGGYFYIVDANLPPKLLTYGTTAPSGSGGAWTVGSFTQANATALPGGTSTLFGSGRIVRDMGKTQVSAGRTFRKIKGLVPTTTQVYGVADADGGLPAGTLNSSDAGYLTFYVETTREGDGAANPAGLVRFM